MSADIIYLDNREALLTLLADVRAGVEQGSVSSIAAVVCYEDVAGAPSGRAVYVAIKDSTLERDRLVMGAELLKHAMLMAEEEDANELAGGDEPPREA